MLMIQNTDFEIREIKNINPSRPFNSIQNHDRNLNQIYPHFQSRYYLVSRKAVKIFRACSYITMSDITPT